MRVVPAVGGGRSAGQEEEEGEGTLGGALSHPARRAAPTLDRAGVVALWRKAADRGHAESQARLGMCYCNG